MGKTTCIKVLQSAIQLMILRLHQDSLLEREIVLALLLLAQGCNKHCEYFCHVLISSQ